MHTESNFCRRKLGQKLRKDQDHKAWRMVVGEDEVHMIENQLVIYYRLLYLDWDSSVITRVVFTRFT